MALAELLEKIMDDANKEADRIRSEANDEKDKIIEKAEAELKDLQKQVEAEAERIANEKFQNIVTLARVEGKNKSLAVKREMVDEVFEKAEEKLKELSAADFRALAERLLLTYKPAVETKLMVGSENRKIIGDTFIDGINQKLKSAGKYVLVDSDRDFKYGFYLVTDKIEVDLTFEGILRSVREDFEMKVINILFGEG